MDFSMRGMDDFKLLCIEEERKESKWRDELLKKNLVLVENYLIVENSVLSQTLAIWPRLPKRFHEFLTID